MAKKHAFQGCRVSIEAFGDYVKVAATDNGKVMFHSVDSNGVPCGAFSDVYPPNMIERFLGVTHGDKIRRAEQRWNRWLDHRDNIRNVMRREVKCSRTGGDVVITIGADGVFLRCGFIPHHKGVSIWDYKVYDTAKSKLLAYRHADRAQDRYGYIGDKGLYFEGLYETCDGKLFRHCYGCSRNHESHTIMGSGRDIPIGKKLLIIKGFEHIVVSRLELDDMLLQTEAG